MKALLDNDIIEKPKNDAPKISARTFLAAVDRLEERINLLTQRVANLEIEAWRKERGFNKMKEFKREVPAFEGWPYYRFYTEGMCILLETGEDHDFSYTIELPKKDIPDLIEYLQQFVEEK